MILLLIHLLLAASLLLSVYIMTVTLERCRSEKRYGFFFFAADYCEIRLPEKFYRLPILIIPVLFYLVVLTFDYHGLLYSNFYYDAEKFIPGIAITPGPLYLVGTFS
jgi:hypothetical protein